MFIWNKLLKIKDTEENHITEAKNRLNYLKWIIKKSEKLTTQVR